MEKSPITLGFHKSAYPQGDTVPTFILPGVVCGTVHIVKQQVRKLNTVAVVFKGHLEAVVNLDVSLSGSAEVGYLRQSVVEQECKHHVDWPAARTQHGSTLNVLFSFAVGTSAPQTQVEEVVQTSCYPPSISVEGRRLQDLQATPDNGIVAYRVEVVLLDNDIVVGSQQARIRVLNASNDVSPPISLDDFPGDYVCSMHKQLGFGKVRTWMSHKIAPPNPRFLVAIEVQEPKPIRLDPFSKSSNPGFVELVASLQFSQLYKTSEHQVQHPGAIEVNFQWSIKHTTFVSLVAMQKMPSRSSRVKNDFIRKFRTLTPTRKVKMVLRDWKAIERHDQAQGAEAANPASETIALGVAQGKGADIQWQSIQRLHLPIDLSSHCATTFFTPHISRRSALLLRLECCSDGAGRARFELEVPLQIVFINRSTRGLGLEVGDADDV